MVQRIFWTSKISLETLSSEIVVVRTRKIIQISIASRKNIKTLGRSQDEKNVPRHTIFKSFPEHAHLPKRELAESTADLEITNTVTSVANASTM